MKLDNHMIENLDICDLKFKEGIEDAWQPRMKGAPLGFGTAVHAGLATWYSGLKEFYGGRPHPKLIDEVVASIEKAWPEDHPVDDYRTMERAKGLVLAHIKEYPQESFRVLSVETPFVLPLRLRHSDPPTFLPCYLTAPFDLACGTMNPPDSEGLCPDCRRQCEIIEYGGVFDLNVSYGESVYYVVDHKSTSRLGDQWVLQFKPNNQVTGYCWGSEGLTGVPVGGAWINGLCLTSSGNISFKRHLTARDHNDYREWFSDVYAKACQIARNRRSGVWPKRTINCQWKYGMCTYHGIHVLTDEDERRRRRETDYVKRPWDFENRDGEGT